MPRCNALPDDKCPEEGTEKFTVKFVSPDVNSFDSSFDYLVCKRHHDTIIEDINSDVNWEVVDGG